MFKDHFSGHASDYAAHRPTYPPALFSYLASLCERRQLVWDAGTGNGQAAVDLAAHFERVVATDPSEQQLSNAIPHRRVEYRIARSEESPLEGSSADLVTVAQAFHWFDASAFFEEARRVLRPNGVLAVWCYGTFFGDETDATIARFRSVVDSYWPLDRTMGEDGYADVTFPFNELPAPGFEMSVLWTADQTLNYLRTWSAVRRYIDATGKDPVDEIADELRATWKLEPRRVSWPLHLRVMRT